MAFVPVQALATGCCMFGLLRRVMEKSGNFLSLPAIDDVSIN